MLEHVLIENTGLYDGLWMVIEVLGQNIRIDTPYVGYAIGVVSHFDRNVDDLTNFVIDAAWTEAKDAEIGTARIIVAENDLLQFGNQYKPDDVVELWVCDGYSSPQFPSSIRDTSKDSKRAFLGSIESVKPLRGSEVRFEILARDYGSDLMRIEIEQFYYESTYQGLLDDFTIRLNEARGSRIDQFIGVPGFSISRPTWTTAVDDAYWNDETFWDAYLSVARIGGYIVFVDGKTYSPRASGGSSNRPTIVITLPETSTTLSWSAIEGDNIADVSLNYSMKGLKNKVTLISKDKYNTVIEVTKSTSFSTGLTYGVDKHGEINGISEVENIQDYKSIEDLTDRALDRVDDLRRELEITISPGRFDAGERLPGNLLAVNIPSLELDDEYEVLEASYKFNNKGLFLTLQIGSLRPEMKRIFCRPFSKTRPTSSSALFSRFRIWYVVYSAKGPKFRSMSPFTAGDVRDEFTVLSVPGALIETEAAPDRFTNWAFSPGVISVQCNWAFIYQTPPQECRIELRDVVTNQLVARGFSLYNAAGYTINFTQENNSGISGSVLVSGAQTADKNGTIKLGLDPRNALDSFTFAYHRGFIYVIMADQVSKSHIMRKYTKEGLLLSQGLIGVLNQAWPNNTPGIIEHMAMERFSPADTPRFIVTVDRAMNPNNFGIYYSMIYGSPAVGNFGGRSVTGSDLAGNPANLTGFDGLTYDDEHNYIDMDRPQGLAGQFIESFPPITSGATQFRVSEYYPARYSDGDPFFTWHNSNLALVGRGCSSDFNGGLWFFRTAQMTNGNWQLMKFDMNERLARFYRSMFEVGDSYARTLCIVPIRPERRAL